MKNKILALLGFCSKAGKMSYGMDCAKDSLNRQKAKLIVIASDVSEKSKKEINFYSNKNNVRVLLPEDISIEELSKAIGKKCGILSVNDISFANGIINAQVMGGNASE